MSISMKQPLRKVSAFAALGLLAVALAAGVADAKSSTKPKKAFWYETCKSHGNCDFSAHVDATKGKTLDYIRATGGCRFYSQVTVPTATKIKNKAFSVDTTVSQFSTKANANVTISIKISGKFKTSTKIKGKYTISDPSGECTAPQMAEHSYTAKARFKQTGG